MNRTQILEKAKEVVTDDREMEYGKPEDNFAIIAEFWSTYLGYGVSAPDVAVMMALLKLARLKSSPFHIDSVVDCAGYMACYGEVLNLPPKKPDAS